ncbi:LuxR C-terminal-related transcriptional regulator [Hyphococcus sp. DH-69]|uniref:LuxR C-terminal-related transcriptional regulator n=1 Tax=Hyphococcus formosus TaxID=3143534 RepID=UPI00398A545A
MQDVIAAKFDPPIWIGGQIQRAHLLSVLDRVFAHRLTLIHAPAGYGKTSLLAQWRERLDDNSMRIAWLTLERDDRDLKRFVKCLSVAIREAETQKKRKPISGDLPPRAALSAIINELGANDQPFLLILDDLHHAESPQVCEFLNSLIRLAPPNCHFVFASRDNPSLGQSVLAAEEQLLEITARELKFSEQEAETLLTSMDEPLEKAGIEKILARTEGWPIAVQLASLSLKRGGDQKTVIEQYSGSSADLARYLSDQVLMGLPEETRDIVIRTSLLDRLDGDLVNLLCDREDGWLVLEGLEQQGVFLSPMSANRRDYRYHQLFAEYLRDRLERSDPAKFRSLQQSLARWFAEKGMTTEAINHAIFTDNNEFLGDILIDAGGWRLIPQGLQSVVERGLSKLTPAYIRSRPPLMLAHVYLLIKIGELGAARAQFDRLEEEGDYSADLRTDIRVVGDTLADYENRPISLDDLLAREALLRKLPADDHLVLAHITETLGAKYFEGGWLERALQPTLAAREHYQAFGSVYSDVFTRFLEARIKRSQGKAKEAGAILDETRKTIDENFGDRSDLAANCAAFQAELLYEEDRVSDARALLNWALPHMEQSDGWVDVYSVAYLTEARALIGEGSVDEASDIISRAHRVASRRRLNQLNLLATIFEIDLQILCGDGPDAAREAAKRLNLDQYADMMSEESPLYRPVAVSASLCRARLSLLEGDCEPAMSDLKRLQSWANQRGAGRLLIDVNILAAYGHRLLGAAAEARSCFDDAVGIAMFQDIIRPFIDARHFVRPCLEDAMSTDAPVDRFREQFLKSMEKSINACRNNVTVLGVFSEAEAEVLYYLEQGYSNKEIARLIGMSPDTVKYRLKSVFKKMGVSKRKDAVRISTERWNLPKPSSSAVLQNGAQAERHSNDAV